MMTGYLASNGVFVGEKRVGSSLRRVDPVIQGGKYLCIG